MDYKMGSCIGPKITTDGALFLIDAGNPRSYSGNGTTVVTCLISGHTGNRVNGTGYSTDNGGSFFFGAGGGATNQYINFNDNAALNPISSCTVCLWFKEQTNTGSFQVLKKWASGIGITGWYLQTTTSGSHNIVWTRNDNNSLSTRGSAILNAGVWYYFCFYPLVATNSTYRNGVSVTYNPISSFSSIACTHPLIVGNEIISSKQGNISQVQIYNRAITAAEILQNYNAQKSRYGL